MNTSSFEMKQNTPDGFISFAKINGVFGIKGQAKIFLYNRETALRDQWLSVFLFDQKMQSKELRIKLRDSGKKVIATIKGYSSPEELEELMNKELFLREEDLPVLEEDEFYHHDLLGLAVKTEEGTLLGVVDEVHSGTVAVFTVKGEETYYIPFISERVLEILPKKHMIVRI